MPTSYNARPQLVGLPTAASSFTMSQPRITIVTPSFNQGRYLDAALQSVLSQGYENLEYIVMDGGSTDGSVEVIRRYADRLAHWQSGPDGGQAAAIAQGFARASGDILAWLNSDDLLLPGSLDLVAKTFARNPSADLIYGSRHRVDAGGHVIGWYQPPTVMHRLYFSFGQWLPQESTFWRRSLYERAGGVEASMFFAMDLSLFMRMWHVGRFMRVDAALGAIRVHEETKTTNHGDVMMREAKVLRRAHGLPSFDSWLVNQIGERLVLGQARIERRLADLRSAWQLGFC